MCGSITGFVETIARCNNLSGRMRAISAIRDWKRYKRKL